MRTILVVGRFQPLHLGHLYLLRRLSRRNRNLLKIVIGSSNEKGTKSNPFPAAVRGRMVKRALAAVGVRAYSLFFIPDVHNDAKWLDLLLRRAGKFDYAVSGNDWVLGILRRAGLEARGHAYFRKRTYNGTRIRGLMSAGGRWQGLVHPEVARLIGKVPAKKRRRG